MREDIFSFPMDMAHSRPFHVDMAGISYCDGSYHIKRAKCPFYAFEYIISGTGVLVENGIRFTPSKGDVYILQKMSIHEYWSDAREPWVKIWFAAAGPLLEQLMLLYGLDKTYYISRCPMERTFRNILAAAKAGLGNKQDVHDAIAVASHKLIARLSPESEADGRRLSPEALEIKRLLDAGVEKSVTLKEIGGAISKSISQTIRIFKKECGVTPYQYLLDRKIASAKLYLQLTRTPVKEIAYKFGFSDEHYFSGLFKEKTGLSPMAFRARAR